MATSAAFLYSCQPLAVFICLVTLTATGAELTLYNTFLTVSLISAIRSTVVWDIAQPTKCLADFFTALHRVEVLLESQDHDGELSARERLQMAYEEDKRDKHDWRQKGLFNSKSDDLGETGSELGAEWKDPSSNGAVQVVLEEVSCRWSENVATRPTLKDISLSVSSSELLLVTGPVGCGKTSLLLAILNELPTSQGKVSRMGNIAYVSQQPWIFSGTVRENILFGQEMDPDRYTSAINVCELETDITRFPDGDLTVIGERGVLLSGGQRSRVALARAVYLNADVYLLDDPLSAVDAKVGKNIFDKCICGVLSQKARILVTHRLQCVKDADHIIMMKEGSIAQEGSYSELLEAGLEFDFLERNNGGTSTKSPSAHDQCGSREILVQGETVGLETEEEDRMTGSVTSGLYWKYFRAGLGCPSLVMLILLFCATQGNVLI